MMSYKQWLVLLFIYIVFMLVGAVVFLYLEIDNELAERQDILELKRKVIDLVYSLENGSRAEVVEVVQELGDNCGEDFLHIDKNKNLVWSYWNSFFFTFTVITTIGFGHMSPATPWGRIFCIVYATIGVPLNGIVIASLADLFSSKVINSRMRARAKRYESWVGIAADAALFLLPGFVVFLIIPAAILVAAEEDWNYLDSFYYAFITLTTIGFGDLVAGQQDKNYAVMWLYKIILFFWIIFGLAYLIMGITLIQKALKSKKIHNIERRLARALKKQASKVNSNFHDDLKRMRTVVNAISVMNAEGEKNSHNHLKRMTSNPALLADDGYSSKTDRIFLSHHHTPEQQRHKLEKDHRSVSDAALSVPDKSEASSRVNPMGNVNIFLDMVESLLKEHEENAAQTADADAHKIIEETVNSDLSDSTSDEDERPDSSNHQAESLPIDLESGYLNKGYLDDDNQQIYSNIRDLPRDAVKHDNEVNDRIQKKLSTLLGVSHLRKTSLAQLSKPEGTHVQTASELLGLVENIVCKPWPDNRQLMHLSPRSTIHQESLPEFLNQRFSSSVPGRYRAAPENGRPHLLDVFHIATAEADFKGTVQLDSPTSNRETVSNARTLGSPRRASYVCSPSTHLRLGRHASKESGNDVLGIESRPEKLSALTLFSKWLHRDLRRANSQHKVEEKNQEFSHL